MIFVGLCTACRHHRWIVSGRGSRFLFCDRSRIDPAFAKYPALPVLGCPGFDDRPAVDTSGPESGAAGAPGPGEPGGPGPAKPGGGETP